jgi:hypothetical protein
MSAPELYGGIGSLIVGVLFVVFPKPIGVVFSRIGRSIWKGHEGEFFSLERIETIYDENRAPKKFRILGIVFLIQAVVFFILSAVM